MSKNNVTRSVTSTGVLLAAGLILAPLMAVFVRYMYLKLRFTGGASGLGGYYLCVAWLALGVWLAPALLPVRGRTARWLWAAALLLAIGFEVCGFWFSAQVYAGVIEKVGSVRSGVGAVWPTPANLALVFSRLREITFAAPAAVFYVFSLVARMAIFIVLIRARPRDPSA